MFSLYPLYPLQRVVVVVDSRVGRLTFRLKGVRAKGVERGSIPFADPLHLRSRLELARRARTGDSSGCP